MSEKSFYDKAKQLSQIVVLGMDISDVDDIYGEELQDSYEKTLEGKMLQELADEIEQNKHYFDVLANRIGYQRANGIYEALMARVGYSEKASREKYEDRKRCENQFETQLEEDEYYTNQQDGMQESLSMTQKNGDYWMEESQIFMRNLEESLYDSIQAFDKKSDNDLMLVVSDVISKYRGKGISISDAVSSEISKIKEQIENEKMEEQIQQRRDMAIDSGASAQVRRFCDEIGEEPSSLTRAVRDKLLSDEFDGVGHRYDSFGPPEVGVNVATFTLKPEENGKRRRLLLSEQIILEAQNGQNGVLEGSQYRFYKNDNDPDIVDYVALTEDEGKRLEMRTPSLEQARIITKKEQEKEELEEKSAPIDFPDIF